MSGNIQFPRLGSPGESFNRVPEDGKIFLIRARRQLAQGPNQFLYMLRSGALALQKAFDVTGHQLPLDGAARVLAPFLSS